MDVRSQIDDGLALDPVHVRQKEIRQAVLRDGYAFVRRLEPSLPTDEMAIRIGKPLMLGKSNVAHAIVPKLRDAPNTYSGMYGYGGFPLHTDMAHWANPPRYLMLRCIRGHSSIATIVADGRVLVAEVRETVLVRSLVKPRRPVQGKLPLLTLYRPRRAGLEPLLRWDEIFIIPASVAGRIGMERLRAALDQTQRFDISLTEAGDTLVLDNWRMVHGRSAIAKNAADRIIERAYLEDLHE